MEVARTTDAAEALHEELEGFETMRRNSSELEDLFANPGFDLESKLRVAKEIGEKTRLTDLGARIVEVLIRNHRINQLSQILAAFRAEINERLGRTVALVRSAHDLSAQEKQDLQAVLEKRIGRSVDLEVTTDTTLLGGFVAQFGSEVYDASVLGQISKLRNSLSQ